MKRIIGIAPALISFLITGNALFAQSSDKWYLGEWTDGEETIVIKENKFINLTLGAESDVHIIREPNGIISIIPELYENEGGAADSYYEAYSPTKQIFSVVSYEDVYEIRSVYNRVGTENSFEMGSDLSFLKRLNESAQTDVDMYKQIQAEVLVRSFIPADFILNLESPIQVLR